MPKPVRYLLAALIGALAVPAAGLAIIFGIFMLFFVSIAAIAAVSGRSIFKNGAEQYLGIEIALVLVGAVFLVGAIEATRLLTPTTPRRRIYHRALATGLTASGMAFGVLSFAAYVTLHGSRDPGAPSALLVFAIVLHMSVGLIAWPIWVLKPELNPKAPSALAESGEPGTLPT